MFRHIFLSRDAVVLTLRLWGIFFGGGGRFCLACHKNLLFPLALFHALAFIANVPKHNRHQQRLQTSWDWTALWVVLCTLVLRSLGEHSPRQQIAFRFIFAHKNKRRPFYAATSEVLADGLLLLKITWKILCVTTSEKIGKARTFEIIDNRVEQRWGTSVAIEMLLNYVRLWHSDSWEV